MVYLSISNNTDDGKLEKKIIEGKYYDEGRLATSVRMMQLEMGAQANWCSVPEIIDSAITVPMDKLQPLHYRDIVANSEIHYLNNKNGKPIVIGIHGGGIFSSPDRIMRYFHALDGSYTRQTVKDFGILSPSEIEALQNEKLPDKGIPFLRYEDWIKGSPIKERNYAVIIPGELIDTKNTGALYWHGTQERIDDPIMLFFLGGRSGLRRMTKWVHEGSKKDNRGFWTTVNEFGYSPVPRGYLTNIDFDTSDGLSISIDTEELEGFGTSIFAYSSLHTIPKSKDFESLPLDTRKQIIKDHARVIELVHKQQNPLTKSNDDFSFTDQIPLQYIVMENLIEYERDVLTKILQKKKYEQIAQGPGSLEALNIISAILGDDLETITNMIEKNKNPVKPEDWIIRYARKFARNNYPSSIEMLEHTLIEGFANAAEDYATEEHQKQAFKDLKESELDSFAYAEKQLRVVAQLTAMAKEKGIDVLFDRTSYYAVVNNVYQSPEQFIKFRSRGITLSNKITKRMARQVAQPEQLGSPMSQYGDLLKLLLHADQDRSELETEAQKELAMNQAKEIWK